MGILFYSESLFYKQNRVRDGNHVIQDTNKNGP